jgi:hypothetical protein
MPVSSYPYLTGCLSCRYGELASRDRAREGAPPRMPQDRARGFPPSGPGAAVVPVPPHDEGSPLPAGPAPVDSTDMASRSGLLGARILSPDWVEQQQC